MQFNIEMIGIIAGIFSTAGFVPQVYKTWRTKSVEDLSMGMIVILVIGILLWLIYGFYKNAPSILLANSMTLVLILFLLVFKIRYKEK